MKKVIIFDLDGTLAESKQSLDAEMASLLKELTDTGRSIAVMSGGSLAQYKEQFLPFLTLTHPSNLFLLPTSGAALYRYEKNDWKEIYTRTIPLIDRTHIIAVLKEAAGIDGLIPKKTYGDSIEDRGTQITYSGLGQRAPLSEKKMWDADQTKRKKIVAYCTPLLPQFMAHIGGMTSIDITEKGIDKAYGIQELSKLLSIPIDDMVYIGDALYPGGNDEPVKASGIDCIEVKNIADTKAHIRAMLSK